MIIIYDCAATIIISIIILYCALIYHTKHAYVALISRWVFNLVLNSFSVADFLTNEGNYSTLWEQHT